MNGWELGLCGAVVAIALMLFRLRAGRDRIVLLAAAVITISAAASWPRDDGWPIDTSMLSLSADPSGQPAVDSKGQLPAQLEREGFVSSKSCRSCHPGHYASWHATYHRTMTQIVTPKTVVADFDNVQLESRGRSYQLERQGDEFWVTMADPLWEQKKRDGGFDLSKIGDPRLLRRQIVLSTGSHHFQGYWLADTQGTGLRLLPWLFHIADRRWIPIEDTFLRPPDEERSFLVWNNVCIKCHSVGGNPKAPSPVGPMPSEVAEFGISCEACHGPAEEHVAFYRNPIDRYLRHWQRDDGTSDTKIVNPLKLSHERASQACGQCHSGQSLHNQSEYLVHGCSFRAGGDLEQTHHVFRGDPDQIRAVEMLRDTFWNDGTCRVGGDELNGLIESPCYQRGEMSCLSCHSMHDSHPNDQLARGMDGNRACLQCHESFKDRIEEHTHHPAGSSGSLCYNCHMPNTTYALYTAMRSHRVVTPRVEGIRTNNRPNACNLCHLDRTLEWTADQLSDWYGHDPIDLNDEERTVAASLLWTLRGDAAQRIISVWHMGWDPAHKASGDSWQAPFVARLLDDPYSAVRYVAHKALLTLPHFEGFDYDFIAPLNERAAAADRATGIWQQRLPEPQNPRNESILLTPDGQLLKDEVDRLIQHRDETRVNIPE